MKLTVTLSGLKDVQGNLTRLAASDLPITVATTLSRLAAKAQEKIRMENLPAAFTLRRPDWARSGVRITPATKRSLEAEVYDRNEYMLAQEDAGVKYPRYGRYIAIPLRGARPARTSLIAPANRPHAVMAMGGFIRGNVMYKTGGLRTAGRGRDEAGVLRRREGPASLRRFSGRKILPMYYLVPVWKWKPRYAFRSTVVRLVENEHQAEFQKAFEQYARH